MKKIKDDRLARISSLSELKAMQSRVKRQQSQLEERMRNNLARAKEQYSLMDIAKMGFTVIDTIQSVLRYAKKE
jgi:hypothetical protein